MCIRDRLKTKDEAERLAASRELLDYGFQNYEVAQVADKGDRVGEIDVKNGKSLTVPVKIDDCLLYTSRWGYLSSSSWEVIKVISSGK